MGVYLKQNFSIKSQLQETISSARKHLLAWTVGAIVGAAAMSGLLLTATGEAANPVERALAREEDRDAFWEEVKRSSGDWIPDAGRPIVDNGSIASLPVHFRERSVAHNNPEGRQVLSSHVSEEGLEKWIDVDLSEQKLYAHEGGEVVFEKLISSGKRGYETVQGEFRVWRKVRYQAYRGGSRRRGDYYYLPNVPFSLFFYKGYAMHGAYWHNDFGIRPRSHGCINLSIADAEVVWNWAGPYIPDGVNAVNSSEDNPGIRIVVHE